MMPSQGSSPDTQLVAAARIGRAEAWDELVGRHYQPLLRYLTVRTAEPCDAAELAQDTFLAALNLLDRLPCDRPFVAWLYRIAQNLLRRHWRRQALRRVVSLDQLVELPATAIPALRDQGDVATSVAEQELVEVVLLGLSPPLRDALLLSCSSGLRAVEVAAALQISIPAAERRLSRAKAQFRARYIALSDDRPRGGGQGTV